MSYKTFLVRYKPENIFAELLHGGEYTTKSNHEVEVLNISP